MPVSQFAEKLTVAKSSEPLVTVQGRQLAAGTDVIHVGGPLDIAAPEDYEHPISVQFQVVQVPRGDRTEEEKSTQSDVKRVRGIGAEVEGQRKWEGTVELGELEIGAADDIKKETRGVAIAVLERKHQFAFDTITWCDEVELVNGPAQSA